MNKIARMTRDDASKQAVSMVTEATCGSGAAVPGRPGLDFVAYTQFIDDIVIADGDTLLGALGGSVTTLAGVLYNSHLVTRGDLGGGPRMTQANMANMYHWLGLRLPFCGDGMGIPPPCTVLTCPPRPPSSMAPVFPGCGLLAPRDSCWDKRLSTPTSDASVLI